MVFLVHFGLFSKKRGSSLVENHQEMASQYQLRQFRDLYVYELQHLDRKIARLGGFLKYNQLKATGGNTSQLEPLIERRYIVLDQVRKIEPKLGLNVYTVQ